MSVDQGQSPRPIDQCRDVQDVLDQIRLRPSMWVRQGCLRDLQNILIGYAAALSVHGVDEPFTLSPGGPFAEWLVEAGRCLVAGLMPSSGMPVEKTR
ncbi:hypothetical protein [Streptomyces sp. SLBN-31]|uniref:hypothetical protein n=1 Tax=Streptomyces sp. SLBN-31 TaxID=2768444 RepID=UPI001C9304CA|nr:hypothetical protein [Streptomyces sp. SLBN-31]